MIPKLLMPIDVLLLLMLVMMMLGFFVAMSLRYPHLLFKKIILLLKKHTPVPIIMFDRKGEVTLDVVPLKSKSFTWRKGEYFIVGNPIWIKGLGGGYIYYEGCSFPINVLFSKEKLDDMRKEEISKWEEMLSQGEIDEKQVQQIVRAYYHVTDPIETKSLLDSFRAFVQKEQMTLLDKVIKMNLLLTILAVLGVFIVVMIILQEQNILKQLTKATAEIYNFLKALAGGGK